MASNAVLQSLLFSEDNVRNIGIKRTPIVGYGIIKKVLGEGIVQVVLSVYPTENEPKAINCVYANLASSSFALYLKPNVDDKVLVLFTQYFASEMFDVAKKEPLHKENSASYSYNTGIAIPINQFKESSFDNSLSITDGAVDLKLKYDDKTNTLTIDSNGISIADVNGNKIDMTSDGMTLEDINGCKIEMTSNGTLINGKLKVLK